MVGSTVPPGKVCDSCTDWLDSLIFIASSDVVTTLRLLSLDLPCVSLCLIANSLQYFSIENAITAPRSTLPGGWSTAMPPAFPQSSSQCPPTCCSPQPAGTGIQPQRTFPPSALVQVSGAHSTPPHSNLFPASAQRNLTVLSFSF